MIIKSNKNDRWDGPVVYLKEYYFKPGVVVHIFHSKTVSELEACLVDTVSSRTWSQRKPRKSQNENNEIYDVYIKTYHHFKLYKLLCDSGGLLIRSLLWIVVCQNITQTSNCQANPQRSQTPHTIILQAKGPLSDFYIWIPFFSYIEELCLSDSSNYITAV